VEGSHKGRGVRERAISDSAAKKGVQWDTRLSAQEAMVSSVGGPYGQYVLWRRQATRPGL
jgi:hypothetical protein